MQSAGTEIQQILMRSMFPFGELETEWINTLGLPVVFACLIFPNLIVLSLLARKKDILEHTGLVQILFPMTLQDFPRLTYRNISRQTWMYFCMKLKSTMAMDFDSIDQKLLSFFALHMDWLTWQHMDAAKC